MPPWSRPIIPLLIGFAAGIVPGKLFPDHSLAAWTAIFFCVAGLIRRRHQPAVFLPLVLFVCLGYLSVQPWTTSVYPETHFLHADIDKTWRIDGIVISQPSTRQDRTQFDLKLNTLGQNETWRPVIGAIRVTAVGNLTEPVARGDRVLFPGKIRSIRNFTNPGGFDYRQYLRFVGIDGSVYVKASAITVKPEQQFFNWMKSVDRARGRIASLIETVSQGDERAVLKALLIGDKQDISEDLTRHFSRAGISHLLAISGLHVGIVAGVAFWIFTRVLSYVPSLLRNARVKKVAAILSIPPIIFYGLLAGMSPSTQRAVIMIAIFMMTFLIERDQESFNSIATAALVILILHPPSLFSISFQLSFASVLAIVAGMSLIYRKNPDRPQLSWKQKLISPVLVSLFATAGTFPIVMYYMNQFSLISPVANFLVVPLVGFGVVPSGLMAICLHPFSVTGAEWILSFSRELLHVSLLLARFFGNLPFASVTTITPSLLEMGCYYVLLVILYQLATSERHPDAISGHPKTGRTHVPKPVVAVLGVLGIVIAFDIVIAIHQRLYHSDLRMTIIDVGQGNSSLVELPKGQVMVIDGGGFSDQSVFDVGHRIVGPVLLKKRIRTIDILVLSHPDADHLNGLVYMVKHFNIGEIWATGETSDSEAYREFRKIIRERQIPLPDFVTLNRNGQINGTTVRILYPPPDALKRMERGIWPDRNNNSIAVSVGMGSASVLFPGDVMADAEKEMIAFNPDGLKSRILIAPHHGSKTSSTPTFLKAVDPESVIISASWSNRQRLPHPSVMARYRQAGYTIYNTAENGAIRIQTDGDRLEIVPMVQSPSPVFPIE